MEKREFKSKFNMNSDTFKIPDWDTAKEREKKINEMQASQQLKLQNEVMHIFNKRVNNI